MYRVFPFLLLIILGLNLPAKAQGDLLVAPTRMVFEGKVQKGMLYLTNTGKDTVTYSISLIQYAMRENGSLVAVEKPDSSLMVATPYLRIFPRRVTLAPGESQSVMLQCRRTANMAAGEYRSHIYFRSENNYTPLGLKSSSKDSSISVRLIPIYGISIPVIIRSEQTSVTATLSDLRVDQSKDTIQNLALTINRIGKISIYGDINVEFTPAQGKPYKVGLIKGIGVYTTINRRFISLPLKDSKNRVLKNGKLKVQYVSGGDAKRIVYAENELEI